MIGGIAAAVIIYGNTVSETECEAGYVNVENVCVDMCEDINCGIGGACSGGNCTCETGYADVDNYCEETCALSPCKELITRVRKVICIYFLFIVSEYTVCNIQYGPYLISFLRILGQILNIVSTRMEVMNSNANVTKDLMEKYAKMSVL